MIIGLVGFIGSGKGTVGEILCDRGFQKDSFAAPLKDAVSTIFGWSRELLEGDTLDSRIWREKPDKYWSDKFGYVFTPRIALQLMGTEAGRDVFHKDIWVISLLNRAKDKNIVVTDVRFQNEIKYIQDNNGFIIRVMRGDEPEWYRPLVDIYDPIERQQYMSKYDVHSSEWDWIGASFDGIIMNDTTLHDLNIKVDDLLLKFNL